MMKFPWSCNRCIQTFFVALGSVGKTIDSLEKLPGAAGALSNTVVFFFQDPSSSLRLLISVFTSVSFLSSLFPAFWQWTIMLGNLLKLWGFSTWKCYEMLQYATLNPLLRDISRAVCVNLSACSGFTCVQCTQDSNVLKRRIMVRIWRRMLSHVGIWAKPHTGSNFWAPVCLGVGDWQNRMRCWQGVAQENHCANLKTRQGFFIFLHPSSLQLYRLWTSTSFQMHPVIEFFHI